MTLAKRIIERSTNFVSHKSYLWKTYIMILIFLRKIQSAFVGLYFGCKPIKLIKIYDKIGICEGRICHILGSGMSVNKSYININKNDYVIAINASGILPLKIDMYIRESTSIHRSSDFKKKNVVLSNKLFDKVKRDNPNAVLIMKNMWKTNVNPKIYDTTPSRLNILPEILLPFDMPQEFEPLNRFVIDFILNQEKMCIIQIISSVLTAITIAYKAGFQDIRIHGLDGQGSHFFHSDIFYEQCDVRDRDILLKLKELIPPQEENFNYAPGSKAKDMFPIFKEILNQQGVFIELV